jgi:hypothetical protein
VYFLGEADSKVAAKKIVVCRQEDGWLERLSARWLERLKKTVLGRHCLLDLIVSVPGADVFPERCKSVPLMTRGSRWVAFHLVHVWIAFLESCSAPYGVVAGTTASAPFQKKS